MAQHMTKKRLKSFQVYMDNIDNALDMWTAYIGEYQARMDRASHTIKGLTEAKALMQKEFDQGTAWENEVVEIAKPPEHEPLEPPHMQHGKDSPIAAEAKLPPELEKIAAPDIPEPFFVPEYQTAAPAAPTAQPLTCNAKGGAGRTAPYFREGFVLQEFTPEEGEPNGENLL